MGHVTSQLELLIHLWKYSTIEKLTVHLLAGYQVRTCIQVCFVPQGPHLLIVMTGEGGGGPSNFFGSEILAKKIFFWVYERHWDFLRSRKKKTARDFWGCEKKTKGFWGYARKVVIFWGRQILKLRFFLYKM